MLRPPPRSTPFPTRRSSDLGGLYVVPWFLTYFALMGYYPEEEVFDAPVPWLTMLQDTDRWVVIVYGVLVGWTLVATAVGLIQSVLLRIDNKIGRASCRGRVWI